MDRYKYRVWDSDAECFSYSTDQNDDYYWCFEKGEIKVYFNTVVTPSDPMEAPYPSAEEVEGKIEAYTGFKDKNGVEIYFGCQAKHVDGMGSRIGTVVFDERMCCMGIKFEETTVFGGAVLFEQCEVIHDKEQQ